MILVGWINDGWIKVVNKLTLQSQAELLLKKRSLHPNCPSSLPPTPTLPTYTAIELHPSLLHEQMTERSCFGMEISIFLFYIFCSLLSTAQHVRG